MITSVAPEGTVYVPLLVKSFTDGVAPLLVELSVDPLIDSPVPMVISLNAPVFGFDDPSSLLPAVGATTFASVTAPSSIFAVVTVAFPMVGFG